MDKAKLAEALVTIKNLQRKCLDGTPLTDAERASIAAALPHAAECLAIVRESGVLSDDHCNGMEFLLKHWEQLAANDADKAAYYLDVAGKFTDPSPHN